MSQRFPVPRTHSRQFTTTATSVPGLSMIFSALIECLRSHGISSHTHTHNTHVYTHACTLKTKHQANEIDGWVFQEPSRSHATLSTLARVLADVSTYCTPHSSALPRASSTGTCLRSSRSDLLPTTNRGILSSSALTRRICSLWVRRQEHSEES